MNRLAGETALYLALVMGSMIYWAAVGADAFWSQMAWACLARVKMHLGFVLSFIFLFPLSEVA